MNQRRRESSSEWQNRAKKLDDDGQDQNYDKKSHFAIDALEFLEDTWLQILNCRFDLAHWLVKVILLVHLFLPNIYVQICTYLSLETGIEHSVKMQIQVGKETDEYCIVGPG